MPEATDLRRGVASGGFWTQRAASSAVSRPRRLVRADGNKENVPPAGWVASTPWRRRGRKSPLPEWYPRVPLRDITAIVNAIEKRRLRVEAAARAARANQGPSSSPGNSPQDHSVIDRNNHIGSTPNPTPTTTASSSSSSAPTPGSTSQTEAEEKLSRSIDQIERIVKKNNLKKKTENASDKKRVMLRKTLLSMR